MTILSDIKREFLLGQGRMTLTDTDIKFTFGYRVQWSQTNLQSKTTMHTELLNGTDFSSVTVSASCSLR